MNALTFFVMAGPDRIFYQERLRASLRDSDVGEVHWREAKPQGEPWDHWEIVHREASEADTDFVCILEDDVIAGRHLRHNLKTFLLCAPALDPAFGALWAFNLGGRARGQSAHLEEPYGAGAQCAVYRTSELGRLITMAVCLRDVRGGKSEFGWDAAVSHAVWLSGKRVWIHYPSLVEHPDDAPSLTSPLKTLFTRTSSGTFDLEWRANAKF